MPSVALLRARRALLLIAGALLAVLASPAVLAQAYPDHPVRIIVPFPPGGGTDIIARILGQKLSETMGQSFVVENRAGAGGTIGSEVAAHAPRDGYTLLMVSASYSVSPSLYKLNFDPLQDLVPVSLVASVPFVLVTYPSFAANTVGDVIAAAKAKPGSINFASSGTGSAPHLAGEMLALNTGTRMVHVPFKGGAPAMTEVMSGRVQLLFSTVTQALPYLKGGQLKPLAVSSHARAHALPQVPTLEEAGVSGIDVGDWFGFLVPKGTPPAIVKRLGDGIRRAVASPDVKARLTAEGFDAIGSSGDDFDRIIRRDLEAYGRVVKDAKVKVE